MRMDPPQSLENKGNSVRRVPQEADEREGKLRSSFYFLPFAFCLLPLAFGLWPLAFGLWPFAFSLLPSLPHTSFIPCP
ncbi:MAG: hypothetical protein OEW19_11305, partial [Acidobacteriota bacterium]|nr:hypothetical protein [Acidobacteriota bacterium]